MPPMNKFQLNLDRQADVLRKDLDAGRIDPEAASKQLLELSRLAGNGGWAFSDGDYPSAHRCIQHLFAHPEASLEVLVNLYHGLDDIWLSPSIIHGLSRNPMVPVFIDVVDPEFSKMVVVLTKYCVSNNIGLNEDIFQENLDQLKDIFDTIDVIDGDNFMVQIEDAEPMDDPFYWASRCDKVAKIFKRGKGSWRHPLHYLFDQGT